MKKIFTKTLLIAIIALVSATTASAYSVRLSDKYEVAGYKMKAFYNLTSNASGIMPTSGDLRYRDANNGLFNFGGGNRGADLAISVAKDDIIVFDCYDTQTRGATINSVTNGTKVAALSGTYPTFSISADASPININVGRAGCVVSIVVMEKDNTTATADYTINYKLGETTVKTVTGNEVIGNTVNADASFVENGVKYIATSETRSMTIANGTNVLNINVREAYSYTYSVVAKYGETTMATLAEGTSVEGDNVTVGYPQYFLNNGNLFSAPQGSGDWFRRTFMPNADNFVENIAYKNANIANVVFYTEAELIAGASVGANTARASRGTMGYTANSITYINATTLTPGKYKIFARGVNGNSATRIANFKIADNVVWSFSIPNGTNVLGNSEEFSVYNEATLEFACDGSSASGCDWFYIVKTGDATVNIEVNDNGTASYVAPCNLDFEGSDLKAYVATAVSETTITLAEVTKVAAGEAIVVKGESCNVNVIAEADAPATNLFKAGAYTVEAGDNIFALSKNDGKFHKVAEGVTIPEGKAYIALPATESKAISLNFDGDVTGIKTTTAAKQNTNAYNLFGQKVSANAKGIVIINGKKINNK